MAKHEQSSAIHVQKFLGGLDYPAGKQELIDKAEENGADRQTVQLLENMAEGQYDSPLAVSREVSRQH